MRFIITVDTKTMDLTTTLDTKIFELDDDQVTKLNKILAQKEKKPKAPRLPYHDMGNEDFELEELEGIFNDDGEIEDIDSLKRLLREYEYISWDSED